MLTADPLRRKQMVMQSLPHTRDGVPVRRSPPRAAATRGGAPRMRQPGSAGPPRRAGVLVVHGLCGAVLLGGCADFDERDTARVDTGRPEVSAAAPPPSPAPPPAAPTRASG